MFALADRHGERGETGICADLLGDELVEREAVAESWLTRVRRAGEEALPGVVIAVDAGVGESRESRELVALFRQQVEVGAGSLTGLREEVSGHHAQGHVDGQQALGRSLLRGFGEGWQGQTGAGSEEEVTSVHGQREVGRKSGLWARAWRSERRP